VDEFPVALDLGSHSGLALKYLENSKGNVKTLFQTDLSEKMLLRDMDTKISSTLNPFLVVADEEFIPFADSSLDLVISNLSLHWVNDLPGTFTQIKQCLKPNGIFIASMFGEGTLVELRCTLLNFCNIFTLKKLFCSCRTRKRRGNLSPYFTICRDRRCRKSADPSKVCIAYCGCRNYQN